MQDKELYRHLLGLATPWTVSEVKLSMDKQQVDVWAAHADGLTWQCPTCSKELPLYDHSEVRAWRHLDSCQFKTYLHARPPRVQCPEHGVLQVRLPWAEPRARFTALFERLAIDVLRETDILGATRILGISWDEAWHILERAVERGMLAKEKRVVARIGIDEKAAAKGQTYLTLVCDLDHGTVEYVGDGRKTESLDAYYESLTSEQRGGIEAVAMDMWDAFIKSTRTHVEGAADKIVFDRFHVMQDVGDAVDEVRRREHKELKAEGDETLVGSKYLWLYAEENLPEKHRERFDALRKVELKTGRAWAIKEALRELWNYRSRGWAMRHWKRWYFWATHSRLKPIVEAAKTIERHLHNVMTFFTHRITNAVSEGLNSKIQTIKKMAYGFRNRDHFKTAIYFRCGGLSLYPVTHGKVG